MSSPLWWTLSDLLDLQWRELRRDDRQECNYILSSWLRSYCRGCPEFRSIDLDTYYPLYTPVVKQLIARSTVAVCWDPSLPNTVLGYLVTEGDDTVHYVHTKPRFRRCGVARWMTRELAQLPAKFTHQPNAVALRLGGPQWSYDGKRRFQREAA